MTRLPFVIVVIGSALVTGAAAAGQDGFGRAVAALTAGSRAADRGDAAGLRSAALALQASDARPVAGDDDMAARWLRSSGGTIPTAERDRALGPGYRSLQLRAGDSATFEQTFLAGQRARVAVVPLSRSEFTMRVSDEDRVPLCSASPRHMQCDWVPSYTTRFTIEVANPGHQAGRYVVMMQ